MTIILSIIAGIIGSIIITLLGIIAFFLKGILIKFNKMADEQTNVILTQKLQQKACEYMHLGIDNKFMSLQESIKWLKTKIKDLETLTEQVQ